MVTKSPDSLIHVLSATYQMLWRQDIGFVCRQWLHGYIHVLVGEYQGVTTDRQGALDLASVAYSTHNRMGDLLWILRDNFQMNRNLCRDHLNHEVLTKTGVTKGINHPVILVPVCGRDIRIEECLNDSIMLGLCGIKNRYVKPPTFVWTPWHWLI